MANTFDWVEIRTGRIDRAADFYEALFGWQIIDRQTAEGSDYWIFDTGGTPRLENLQRGAFWLRPAQRRGGIVVYVLVTSIEAILERAVGLGGKVIAPKTSVGTAFKAFVEDPDGNVLGLWEEAKPV